METWQKLTLTYGTYLGEEEDKKKNHWLALLFATPRHAQFVFCESRLSR